jgi:hypothetical protein
MKQPSETKKERQPQYARLTLSDFRGEALMRPA